MRARLSIVAAAILALTACGGFEPAEKFPAPLTTPTPPGSGLGAAPPVVFKYRGAVQTWTVPGGTHAITVIAIGGSGGPDGTGRPGGSPAIVFAKFTVTPGEVLSIKVAGAGNPGICNVAQALDFPAGGGASGGYAGGGTAGACLPGFIGGGGGGGATRITDQAGDVLMVAGGGGGAASGGTGGNGGTPNGGDAQNAYNDGPGDVVQGAYGGTTTAGGEGFFAAPNATYGNDLRGGLGYEGQCYNGSKTDLGTDSGAGGGGGYYGGGGGGYNPQQPNSSCGGGFWYTPGPGAGAGGGGSSYVGESAVPGTVGYQIAPPNTGGAVEIDY